MTSRLNGHTGFCHLFHDLFRIGRIGERQSCQSCFNLNFRIDFANSAHISCAQSVSPKCPSVETSQARQKSVSLANSRCSRNIEAAIRSSLTDCQKTGRLLTAYRTPPIWFLFCRWGLNRNPHFTRPPQYGDGMRNFFSS